MKLTLPRQGDDMTSLKSDLRRSMRALRANIAADEAARAAQRATAALLAEPAVQRILASAGLVALYASMRDELDTGPLATAILAAGATLAYPRVVLGQRHLAFHRANSAADLRISTFQIPEPDPSAPRVPIANIALFVVPGLAFDARGNRLGWGQGHYDITLSENPEALRVGFAYETQIIDTVPTGPHDLPMHMIVTDAGARRCAS
jgi:5-formyltetrahydrofolate cyclo-ligase